MNGKGEAMSDATSSDPEDFCVYCGGTDDLTDDHVPPKTIFPKPRPSGLITVRSCKKCNCGSSRDDEHFRMMLCLRHDSPRLHHLVRIAGPKDDEAGDRAQRRQMLDGLVRRPVLAHADGVMGKHMDRRYLHNGAQPNWGPSIVAED